MSPEQEDALKKAREILKLPPSNNIESTESKPIKISKIGKIICRILEIERQKRLN